MTHITKRRPRRRRTKAETRERLLQAVLEVLHEGGETAVTTVSITRKAGVVQSMFYQHFANVEACLADAAARITTEIREAVAAHRRHMFETGPGEGEQLEQAFREMFDLVARQRRLMELFLRYRSDPLALGGVMYRFGRGLSTDLAEQLLAKFGAVGLTATATNWVAALADDLVAVSLSAIEAFLEGRGSAVDEAARRLAVCSSAMVAAVIGVVAC